ncbi:MAG: ABC transporter substrate-binding protein, partial [Verrucomicrobia bacterium]|nr:ABC transporter substrate-binding protein [Verrucomicrobiota bacterium]
MQNEFHISMPDERLPVSAAPVRGKALVLGYVPLLDSAPLIVAHELGIFAQFGLQVRLSKEPGWATVREKIRLGELSAAQAPASMVFELNYGLGSQDHRVSHRIGDCAQRKFGAIIGGALGDGGTRCILPAACHRETAWSPSVSLC